MPMNKRLAHVPAADRSLGALIWSAPSARNVASSAGAAAPPPGFVWNIGSAARLVPGARVENSGSARADRTSPGAISSTSCGSLSLSSSFSKGCMGAPYSVQCRSHHGGRRTNCYVDEPLPNPTSPAGFDQSKAKGWRGCDHPWRGHRRNRNRLTDQADLFASRAPLRHQIVTLSANCRQSSLSTHDECVRRAGEQRWPTG